MAPLVHCLSSEVVPVQQNCLSALSGLCAVVPGGREAVVMGGAAPKLVTFLSAETPAVVRLNALETVGLLAGAGMGVDALLLSDVHLAVLGTQVDHHKVL